MTISIVIRENAFTKLEWAIEKFIYTFLNMKKATPVKWQHYFENIILIHVIYSLSTKAKGFIHSTRSEINYLNVYGANYLYLVVYDNFDVQM